MYSDGGVYIIFLNLCPEKKYEQLKKWGERVGLFQIFFFLQTSPSVRAPNASKCVVVAREVQPKSQKNRDHRSSVSWTSYVWRRSCASDADRTGTSSCRTRTPVRARTTKRVRTAKSLLKKSLFLFFSTPSLLENSNNNVRKSFFNTLILYNINSLYNYNSQFLLL